MALSTGQQAINDVAAAFDAANKAELEIPELLHASTEMLKLYDLMFPSKGKVYDILKNDHVGHIKGLRKAYEADQEKNPAAGPALFPLLDREVVAKGLKSVRGDLGSAVCSALWLMRTFKFLIRFLDLLVEDSHKSKDAYECARSAYKEILYPYHRMVVSMIVPMALGACSKRRR